MRTVRAGILLALIGGAACATSQPTAEQITEDWRREEAQWHEAVENTGNVVDMTALFHGAMPECGPTGQWQMCAWRFSSKQDVIVSRGEISEPIPIGRTVTAVCVVDPETSEIVPASCSVSFDWTVIESVAPP